MLIIYRTLGMNTSFLLTSIQRCHAPSKPGSCVHQWPGRHVWPLRWLSLALPPASLCGSAHTGWWAAPTNGAQASLSVCPHLGNLPRYYNDLFIWSLFCMILDVQRELETGLSYSLLYPEILINCPAHLGKCTNIDGKKWTNKCNSWF